MCDDFISGLDKYLRTKRTLKTKECLCLWSDLLGFGKNLFENQWILSDIEKEKIYKRLNSAHSAFLRNTSPFRESSLILNDGLVKVFTIDYDIHSDMLGFFIRSCICTHLDINKLENKNTHPGARTILTFGESIEYFHPEIRFDDYVYNYTKKEPNKLSSIAQNIGYPVVVYNPLPFQMNMAFSKAYTLDNLGSKYGIKGNKFFIDESVLDFLKKWAKKHCIDIEETKMENETRFLLKKGDGYVHCGFEWDEEIPVEYKGWVTKVYRIRAYFPPDEKTDDFFYEL